MLALRVVISFMARNGVKITKASRTSLHTAMIRMFVGPLWIGYDYCDIQDTSVQ